MNLTVEEIIESQHFQKQLDSLTEAPERKLSGSVGDEPYDPPDPDAIDWRNFWSS